MRVAKAKVLRLNNRDLFAVIDRTGFRQVHDINDLFVAEDVWIQKLNLTYALFFDVFYISLKESVIFWSACNVRMAVMHDSCVVFYAHEQAPHVVKSWNCVTQTDFKMIFSYLSFWLPT